MDARVRRVIQMGTRSVEFDDAHPDTDAGYQAAAAKLKGLVARAMEGASAQRNGLIDVRAAAARKRELRRAMLSGPIAHMAEVGRAAARESHELDKTFRSKPGAGTFLAFGTAARGMANEAQSHRELLVKYGLSESVLEEFVRMLDEFDAAVKLGSDGRGLHTAATRDLGLVATEIRRTVRVMDARNRQRFEDQAQVLGLWISASTVLGSPHGGSSTTETEDGTTPAAGDVRPAA